MKLLSLLVGLLVLWPGTPVSAVEVIGHRGAPAAADENTIPSFQTAERHGADRVELDVQMLRGGVPVVIHDPTLDRTTDCQGAVADKTWRQVKPCRTEHGWRVRQLAHVCQSLGVPALVDIKVTRVTGYLLRHLEHCPPGTRVMTQDADYAADLAGEGWPVVILRFGPAVGPDLVDLESAAGVDLRHTEVTGALVDEYHDRGFTVYAGTLKHWSQQAEVRRLRDAGVDGVITDRPKRARGAL